MGRKASEKSLRRFAGRYLRKQLKRLQREMVGVRANGNIEPVHQCRVATRRLRAALALFEQTFPAKRLRRWNKPIKRLTQGLGEARDLDVQIEHLQGRKQTVDDPAVARGLGHLIDELIEQRAAIQPQVLRELTRFRSDKSVARMRRYLKKLGSTGPGKPPRRHRKSLRRWLHRCLAERLEALYGYEPCLSDPNNQDQHHRMRVAAKKLRYTLEIGKPLITRRSAAHLDTIKQVQTMLGDIHDHDIWVDRLSERCDGTPESDWHADLLAAMKYLIDQHRTERRTMFDSLVDYWNRMDHEAILGDRASQAGGMESLPVESAVPEVHIVSPLHLPPPPDSTVKIG